DHFVPIDPLSTNQVEVIRGPATLRYGSTAIGGVVASENNRIPEALPCRPTDAAQRSIVVKAPPAASNDAGCWSADARGSVTSIDKGVNGGPLLGAGQGPPAL